MRNGLFDRIALIKRQCSETSDFSYTVFKSAGVRCALIWFEGMISMSQTSDMVYKSLLAIKKPFLNGEKLFDYIKKDKPAFAAHEIEDADIVHAIMSGEIVLLIDNARMAFSFPQQGFSFRAVSESYTEENVRAPREGFVEPLKINMTLVRRRMKSPDLVFELLTVGNISKTDVAIAYVKNKAKQETVGEVKSILKSIKIDTLLESGFIEPFFKNNRAGLFSGIGHTERPDTFSSKIAEGRVGIIVDGTPFALIMPYLFAENFQSFDDYSGSAYYASFIRILKIASFFISVALPGIYVAVAGFNPDILPPLLLKALIVTQKSIALPIMVEALFIHLVYEIVREAGLRLPRPIGHAVSLIGGLIVGETAISAGLVGAPLVMIAALTTVCSFALPALYQPMTIIRFLLIILGNMFGAIGIVAGLFLMFINITAVDTFGVPYAAPLTPFSNALFGDGIVRQSWIKLSHNRFKISKLRGTIASEKEK